MLFADALKKLQLKQAEGMRLPKWKEDVVIRIQFPDEHSKMTHPYLYVESRFGCVPWKETVPEMFDNTWELVGEKKIKNINIEEKMLNYLKKHIDWNNLTNDTMDILEFPRAASKEEIAEIAKRVMESDLPNEEKVERFQKLKNIVTMRLIPVYLVPIIPVGLELISVTGDKIIYDGTNITEDDINNNYNCIKYGINPKEEENA